MQVNFTNDEVLFYALEFRRILTEYGIIIVVEPTYHRLSTYTNRYMRMCDHGQYIRDADGYIALLRSQFVTGFGLCFRGANLYNNTVIAGKPYYEV